ncbi:hypothetical protein OQA88_12969 [Cercophora sp. LCS_1]
MPNNDPVGQLRAHYSLPDTILILRILSPLLNDHGRARIPFLESELASNPSAARLSISTLSSSRSARSLASTLERSSSGMAFSETSSVHSGFMLEDSTPPASQQHLAGSSGRKYRPPPHRVAKPNHKQSAASSPILSPRKPSFECPFCWELKIPTSISRKADLKRHFKQFHQNNVQWICQERGCSRAFDWKSAFEAHLKESHGNSQHPSDSHQVKLCPQVVFACGFSNCRLVFEAACDDDAEKKAGEYFNHVANHFDDNLTHRNWSFSVRVRNLMRQTAVEQHWKDRKKGNQDPVWQPHTSSVVRKILETRHFTDIPLLVQWVVHLGSFAFSQPHSPIPKLPAELRLPIKDSCTIVLDGHGPSLPRRDSHRHMDITPAQPPPKPESGPALKTEPEPDPDPEPEPEPEPEPSGLKFESPPEVEYQQPEHTPPTSHSQHPNISFDHEPAYTTNNNPFQQQHPPPQQDTFIPMDLTAHPPNFVDHWLGLTEPPQAMPLHVQPDLDTIISFPHANATIPHEFRPITPAHQLFGGSHGHGFDGTMVGSTITMGDLEMGDCPFEADGGRF